MSDVEQCARCGRATPPLVPDPGPSAGRVCIPCAGQALGLTPREMAKALVQLMAENLGAPPGVKHIDETERPHPLTAPARGRG